jgi:hypothetical protein
MAREADGPGSKASRSATVARRAQQIYAGKVDPKAKTKSRLTKTRDPEALRKRIAKIKDNTARAAAKAAAKAAKAAAKPKPAILGRVPTKGPGRGPLMKARATPAKPSPKSQRIRARVEGSARPAGTVAKPRGMKPGVIAARRGVKAKPVRLPKSAAQAVTQANRLLDKLKMQKMKNPGGAGSYQIRDRIDQVNQAIKKIVPGYRHNPTRKGGAAKAAFAEQNRRYGRDARARNNIGRLYG